MINKFLFIKSEIQKTTVNPILKSLINDFVVFIKIIIYFTET